MFLGVGMWNNSPQLQSLEALYGVKNARYVCARAGYAPCQPTINQLKIIENQYIYRKSSSI